MKKRPYVPYITLFLSKNNTKIVFFTALLCSKTYHEINFQKYKEKVVKKFRIGKELTTFSFIVI